MTTSVSTAAGALAAEEYSAMMALLEGTAQEIGDAFFVALVRNLCLATGATHAFVAVFATDTSRARTIAYWQNGALAENFEWELAGSPCEDVVRGQLCHYASGVASRYPDEEGIESYLGVPLGTRDGEVMGHLAIKSVVPMPPEPRLLFLFRVFAARAAAELERAAIARRLQDSEERYRDLFEEAPIAYVHEDMDSRLLRANRTALQTLGLAASDVPGFRGKSLVPDTPDARRRVDEAFEAIKRGDALAGVTLELRRQDDGRPLFVQWWSRPDPSGSFTRTMFIDVTARVLLERERERLLAQNQYLREEIESHHEAGRIIGESRPLAAVLDRIRRVAPTDATVLITGETGTGKELVARALHEASRRRDKPLIKINCAALPAALIESELFGHEKGAFTGAAGRRQGRFELADGGTLFLDEIGELPLDMQAKLLRVLQEQEFERVGGSQTIRVDVRIVAATNRDLTLAIEQKAFREDLYYRLNVIPIALPPLRERIEDLPMLVAHFVGTHARRIGRDIQRVSDMTMRRMREYHWPGNIRELENVIERAVILSDGLEIDVAPEMLPRSEHPSARDENEASDSLRDVDRRHILEVLERANWVIEGAQGAAVQLGLAPSTLRYRMRKLGIVAPGTR